MSTSSSRPKPETNNTPAVIDGDQLYLFEEACRRLRWRKHSARQARNLGLHVVRFGSRNYVLGRHILEFFEKLSTP